MRCAAMVCVLHSIRQMLSYCMPASPATAKTFITNTQITARKEQLAGAQLANNWLWHHGAVTVDAVTEWRCWLRLGDVRCAVSPLMTSVLSQPGEKLTHRECKSSVKRCQAPAWRGHKGLALQTLFVVRIEPSPTRAVCPHHVTAIVTLPISNYVTLHRATSHACIEAVAVCQYSSSILQYS